MSPFFISALPARPASVSHAAKRPDSSGFPPVSKGMTRARYEWIFAISILAEGLAVSFLLADSLK